MISVVDYGLGNVRAFLNMYKRLGIDAKPVTSARELVSAQKIILPGVGAFDYAMELLNRSGMRETLDGLVRQDKIPVLGICVGMQILANSSEEGKHDGLGWVPGCVRSFSSIQDMSAVRMPHMGWNDVKPLQKDGLFKNFSEDIRFYFLHSYFYECSDVAQVCATTEYGLKFHCAVQNENVYGVQFHPEKSHHWGASLLRNFAEL